ncbi:ATP-dependent helicase HrpB [Gulosibacter molinativorax]|uniref:ATP-dependent helicase HrpB n=1 Tax=Gulosibacter molinativorax TaxID=256821 RepID=A0ABT7C5A4_9MICO|nr:ATP-dependent helicase HrpB [Gulosibacter molinativorax]MDJ1370369.1 ATP-dependent helicase HrpB [Gulosibacter molinativorax]QUY61282.1 ATP-dependent helicase HrpB [Gulosibacter molinativorax]
MFNLSAISHGLPAAAMVPDLERALAGRGRVVVEAPPGSGKTTVVPPVAANALGRVIVTQPRRIAARAAAARLASLTGTKLGREIGYSVRGDSRTSASTRIEFVTAGLLLRRLLASPELEGVDVVIMDEVHERDLDADLTFAMLCEVAELRDDLALVAMSATIDAERWARLLGEDVPIVRTPAQPHPLEISYAPAPGPRLDQRGVSRPFLEHVAHTTAAELAKLDEGAALVFVPGAWEVDTVVARLRDLGVDALPLTGSLSPAAQDAALRPDPNLRRRAVVATSVAESSLTVPDVRLVIDSGLAREPRLDVERNIAGLVTVPVARASGDQRAGRAARTGPGAAVRLVAEHEWATFPEHARPEILTADLTSAALTLAVWGAPGGEGMALPDAPEPRALARAHETLAALGAIELVEDRVTVTERGRLLARIPTHPRLARALVDAAELVGATSAAQAVAAIESDARAPGADLAALVRQLRRGGTPATRRWQEDVRRLTALLPTREKARAEKAPTNQASPAPASDDSLALVVALAYPDRIARQRGAAGDYLLASGTGATLPADSALFGQEWLAIADLARTPRGTIIRTAVPVSVDTALLVAGPLAGERVHTVWRDDRVVGRRIRAIGAIELSSVAVAPNPAQARAAVIAMLKERGLGALTWSDEAAELRARLGLLHRELGEPWPDVSDAALLERLEEWLGPELDRIASGTSLNRIPLLDPVRRLLPWPEAAQLEALAPERIEVPSGSQIRLDYPAIDEPDAKPILAVKLQECFGWVETPRIIDDRVPVLLHLLSPARRPLAVTDDLASFWANAYAQVRAEMRGRYPKHPWPADPLTAPPKRGTKRSAH